MQGIVTTVSARLGGKHEAPSQYGEQMALEYQIFYCIQYFCEHCF